MSKYYALKSFWNFMKRYKWRLIFVFVLFCISNTFLAVIPVFLGKLIDSATGGIENSSEIWRYVIILVASSSLHDITWRAGELSYMKFVLPLSYSYENGLFRLAINKPYPYFVGKFTGKTASYITNLRQELDDILDNIMWQYASSLVNSVAITVILFSINIETGVVFLSGLALMLIAGRFTISNNMKYESIYEDMKSTKNGKIIDAISNFVNVKSFKKESYELQRLKKEQQTVLKARKKSFKWSVVFWGAMSLFIRHMIWPITIILNVSFYLSGDITIGQLTTLLSAILVFSNFIWDLIWQISQLGLRASRTEEAHRYLFGKNAIVINESIIENKAKLSFKEELSFVNMSFAYPDEPTKKVFKEMNLNIKKGEKIGIVGKSGGGKTTLVKLLLGYYEIPDNALIVDGKAVGDKELLDIISYVPQDSTLFNRSIADNISYATDRNVLKEEIVENSKKALAHEFIKDIPENYDAIVGERGVKLSTGQRQRIAIARAMLQDKPLLILDEATSALDSENEALVQKSLENLWEDRTVISIAHRLSTLKKMDRILVFDKGNIIEDGSIEQLLKKKGAFFDLWNHQVNGMIIE